LDHDLVRVGLHDAPVDDFAQGPPGLRIGVVPLVVLQPSIETIDLIDRSAGDRDTAQVLTLVL
jgi:hypothetical protein